MGQAIPPWRWQRWFQWAGMREGVEPLPLPFQYLILMLKVGFFQKVMAKFSNLSDCHSCEPEIVPELLIPLNDSNEILVIL